MRLFILHLILVILFTSCFSQTNKPKPAAVTQKKQDSCSIAKQFENIQVTEAMVNAGYSGVLNNYMGTDKTKLDFQHFFEKGKAVKSLFYYPNGKVEEEYHYKCGALHGNQQYFYEDGKLAKVIPFSYGYKEGVGELYDKNGQLRQQVKFKGDSIIGKPKMFDEKGKLKEDQ